MARRVSSARGRAVQLEYATVVWNVVEVFVTISLGISAHSLALVAFGLDSLVEIFASLVVLWHLRGERSVRQTTRALWLVAGAFYVLAAVLVAGGVRDLVNSHRPDDSPLGMAYLVVTACVMWGLAVGKNRLSKSVDDHPLVHETRVTFLDGLLAAGIVVALVVNAAFGWWWADAAAAILVGLIAVVEGVVTPRTHWQVAE